MAINFDAIRKRLDNLSGNTKKSSTSWKPKEGEEYTVRLLAFPTLHEVKKGDTASSVCKKYDLSLAKLQAMNPDVDFDSPLKEGVKLTIRDDGQPFKELWFYYNIGNNPGLLTPNQFGKPDPIQELITKLRAEGTKDSYELAKKLYPKMRCYAAVVVRGEEEKGVQIWGFGKQVYQALLGIMLDEDYGDITDPEGGRDVKVKCYKPQGKKFAETEVMPRGKASALSPNSATAKQWLDNIPDVNKMFELKSYEELSKIVNDWVEGGMPTESDGTSRGGDSKVAAVADEDDDSPPPSKPAANTPKKTFKSLDDAFNDLIDS